MSYIPLGEFQKLLGLSDSALVWLLKKSTLQCQIDEEGRIRVDAAATSTEDLVQALVAINEEVLHEDVDLDRERLSKIIGHEFERITREALARYLLKRNTPSAGSPE